MTPPGALLAGGCGGGQRRPHARPAPGGNACRVCGRHARADPNACRIQLATQGVPDRVLDVEELALEIAPLRQQKNAAVALALDMNLAEPARVSAAV